MEQETSDNLSICALTASQKRVEAYLCGRQFDDPRKIVIHDSRRSRGFIEAQITQCKENIALFGMRSKAAARGITDEQLERATATERAKLRTMLLHLFVLDHPDTPHTRDLETDEITLLDDEDRVLFILKYT
jgi:hypothetical protein